MGLIRGVARTAVIAGTATSVSNRVSRRQQGRWAQQDTQEYATQQPPPAPPPAAATGIDNQLEQLKQLTLLKDQGALTDAEFAAQKAKILAG